MGNKLLILLVIYFTNPAFLIAQKTVSFFEENIDFTLDSVHFSINGIYSFHNNSNGSVSQQIIFPFAVNTTMIDSIRIIDLKNGKIIHYYYLKNAISFELKLLPNDTLDINLFYRQKISDTNTYIITTTQLWNNYLEEANYTLTTPKELNISKFSYKPDSISIIDDKKVYTWHKFHFLPQNDFDIFLDKEKK